MFPKHKVVPRSTLKNLQSNMNSAVKMGIDKKVRLLIQQLNQSNTIDPGEKQKHIDAVENAGSSAYNVDIQSGDSDTKLRAAWNSLQTVQNTLYG